MLSNSQLKALRTKLDELRPSRQQRRLDAKTSVPIAKIEDFADTKPELPHFIDSHWPFVKKKQD